MATKVEDALAEIDAALAALAPPREGYKDLAKLVKPENVEAVNRVVLNFDRRWELLIDTKRVINLLLTDSYPALPDNAVPEEVRADMGENTSTVDAAFALTPSGQATNFLFTPGATEPK